MSEKPLDQTNVPEPEETEILVNEYGSTRDSAVVVDEPDRTVLLTDHETIIIDKEPRIDIVPTNRPRKVYGGMWGQPELITIALAMIAVFLVALVYIFMVIPANRELERNRAERDRLEAELMLAQSKYGEISDTKTHVAKLMTSVEEFESTHLPVETNGRTALYQRLNGLIAGHGLVNTTGPDYTPLETLGSKDGGQSDDESGRAKYRSLFPGVYVTMTVEGSYQNLRRFIRQVETGSDFVVVSAVELEPSDSSQKSQEPAQNQQTQVANPNAGFPPGFQTNPSGAPQQPAGQRGKTHGGVVSLRLEMAAYFRRTLAVAPAIEQ